MLTQSAAAACAPNISFVVATFQVALREQRLYRIWRPIEGEHCDARRRRTCTFNERDVSATATSDQTLMRKYIPHLYSRRTYRGIPILSRINTTF